MSISLLPPNLIFYLIKCNLIVENKKAFSLKTEGLTIFFRLTYFLNLAYLVLNLSIRPAVSTNLDFPV